MARIDIAGAGPAGLAAAIVLARAGREVRVHERRRTVGERFGGDYQGIENWSTREDAMVELERAGIEPGFDHYAFDRTYITDTTRTRCFRLPRTSYYLVRRGPYPGSLDRALERQARELGVQIHLESRLAPERADIVATGVLSRRVPGQVHGIAFDTDSSDVAVVVCNDQLAWKGYSYLLVADGQGCLCTVVLGELARTRTCFTATRAYFEDEWGVDIQAPRPVGGGGQLCPRHRLR